MGLPYDILTELTFQQIYFESVFNLINHNAIAVATIPNFELKP